MKFSTYNYFTMLMKYKIFSRKFLTKSLVKDKRL